MSKKICIIPARGGSKRIPRKNIKDFLGKPILAYSIEAALESNVFDEVMVSTDDDEIASIAREYGASVPFMRSGENANDDATTIEVLLEVIDQYKELDKSFEFGCCIYPTAPFVNSSLLIASYEKLLDNEFDSIFPVIKFSAPIQRSLKLNSQERIEMMFPEHLNSRSQDLESAFHDAGQYYWFNVRTIERKRKLWTDNSGMVLLTELQAHDIDNIEDWQIAEFKYKALGNVL